MGKQCYFIISSDQYPLSLPCI